MRSDFLETLDPWLPFETPTLDEMNDACRVADTQAKEEGLEPWTDQFLERRDEIYEENL